MNTTCCSCGNFSAPGSQACPRRELHHNAFRVIASRVFAQVSHRNQNPSADPSGRQSPVRYQVIQPALANGKKLGRLIAAYQQFCICCDGDSCRLLLVRIVHRSHGFFSLSRDSVRFALRVHIPSPKPMPCSSSCAGDGAIFCCVETIACSGLWALWCETSWLRACDNFSRSFVKICASHW